jgi:serine/threonine protein kinase
MVSDRDLYGQPWIPREYIIVLASYFRNNGETPPIDSPIIQNLAQRLGRTPASILMRMENFASLDNSVDRKGLINVGPECRRMFSDWKDRRGELFAVYEFLEGEWNPPMQPWLFKPDPVRIPRAFDRYELMEHLGSGAFGEVYSCVKVDTGQLFAIKILRFEQFHDQDGRRRFGREIRALKSIDHPHVIRLFEDNLDDVSDFPAFVMELGQANLADYVRMVALTVNPDKQRYLLGPDESVEIMRCLLSAVSALHGHEPPLLHRDISPLNILRLPDGRWVLADFSLAKFTGSSVMSSAVTKTTRHGWGYMYFTAPEQWSDFKRADVRADIFSLGMMIWELFSSEGAPPERSDPCIPLPLQGVFFKATARRMDERYGSVSQFAEDFEKAVKECSQKIWGWE